MERLNKEQYLKRVIVVCWIALAICFGIKLFGGNLFEIMCNNENFLKVCEYADNHFLAKYLIYFAQCFIQQYFFTLAIIQEIKMKRWQLSITIITVFVGVFIKLLNTQIGFVFDIWQAIVMPAVFSIKNPKRHWNIILANFLIIIFQLISMFVKNVNSIVVPNEGVLVASIFLIDVLLMILLYYSYSNIIKERREK
jgi:hypothetical protein